jgi:hypothetical protein
VDAPATPMTAAAPTMAQRFFMVEGFISVTSGLAAPASGCLLLKSLRRQDEPTRRPR